MKNLLRAAAAAAWLLAPGAALAQTGPGWSYGYVPTTAQWNQAFQNKQDYLGAPPLLTTGGTMTGTLTTAAPTSLSAGFNLPHGVAPGSPNNGDLWTTTAGIFVQINGSTIGPLTEGSAGSFTATQPLSVSFPGGGVVNYALNFNASLAKDGSNNLGINLSHSNVFAAIQSISLNAAALQSPLAGSLLQIGQADGVATRMELDAYAATPRYSCFRADGTNASKAALAAADEACSLNMFGWDGTASAGPQAAVRMYASANWTHSPISYGTYIDLATTAASDATGTLTSRMRVENDGGVTVGGAASQGAGTLNLLGALYNNGAAPTGTGGYARATNPAFVTPTLGAALATSINGLAITTSTGTLTIAAGKTLTASNSLTLAGTDATTLTFPTTSATIARTDAGQTFSGAEIFSGNVTHNAQGIFAGTSAPASAAGNTVVMGTIAAPTLSNNGQAFHYNTAASGAVTQGQGSTYDVALADNAGAVALGVSTGTVNVVLAGGLTAAALSTSGTVAGSLCQTSAGLFVYKAGLNCFTAGAVTSLAPATTTISPTSSGTFLADVAGVLQEKALTFGAQGRLTLTSHTPVMTGTPAAFTTLYYDAYAGQAVSYYNGVADAVDAIPSNEVSSALAASGTGVLNTASVFDVFWEGNTNHNICVATNGSGGGWASDTGGSNTARGTGYSQIDRSTRPYPTNKNAVAHCYNGATDYGSVAANRLTYLGTIYTSAAGTVAYTFGAAVTAGNIGIWNYWNRVTQTQVVIDSGAANYNYATGLIRQARASAYNQVSAVFGLAEDGIHAAASANGTMTTIGQFLFSNVGLDTTSAFTCAGAEVFNNATATQGATSASTCDIAAQVGYHTISRNEQASASFNLDAGQTDYMSLQLRN